MQMCLAAAAALEALCTAVHRHMRHVLGLARSAAAVKLGRLAFIAAACALSLARSAAQRVHYGAPMRIYRHLPPLQASGGAAIHVCVGEEWHRFPSSFFLPGQDYRLQFLKSGFKGLLPRQFDDAQVRRSGENEAPTPPPLSHIHPALPLKKKANAHPCAPPNPALCHTGRHRSGAYPAQ
jgi:hypothetical protein